MMAIMLESQIALKLLTKSMSLYPPRRLQKSLIHEKWIEVGKVIYSKRNFKRIKITEESIEQKN